MRFRKLLGSQNTVIGSFNERKGLPEFSFILLIQNAKFKGIEYWLAEFAKQLPGYVFQAPPDFIRKSKRSTKVLVTRRHNYNCVWADLPVYVKVWHIQYLNGIKVANGLKALWPNLTQTSLKQDIIDSLKRGDVVRAKKLCWETDKLPGFGDPAQVLLRSLFGQCEEHPWSSAERIAQYFINDQD